MRCRTLPPVALLLIFGLLSGCASFKTQAEIAAGRRYLKTEQPLEALVHFERAARMDPEYVTNFTSFPQSVWTYIGRAHYELGDLPKARAALDRSVRKHGKAILGHTYLGLVQMNQGEISTGLQTASTGLQRLRAWFQVLDATNQYASYWDPSSRVRRTTDELIDDIRTGDKPWPRIATQLEWVGWQMEREIDLSSRDITAALTEGDDTTPAD